MTRSLALLTLHEQSSTPPVTSAAECYALMWKYSKTDANLLDDCYRLISMHPFDRVLPSRLISAAGEAYKPGANCKIY
ncbi:hypothetical protein LZ32DRAFT_5324 [Colletotrichum eremochloae]|nr:hypothetical protein LZ32DRAFT_5324 [Colletotrichum eremochloae]